MPWAEIRFNCSIIYLHIRLCVPKIVTTINFRSVAIHETIAWIMYIFWRYALSVTIGHLYLEMSELALIPGSKSQIPES